MSLYTTYDAHYNESDDVNSKLADTYDDAVCNTCRIDKEAGEKEFLNLRDGRQLCSNCSSLAVMNREGYKCIIENIYQFYNSLDLNVNENIQFLFIDYKEMQRITGGGVDQAAFYRSMWHWIANTTGGSLRFKIEAILQRLQLCTLQPVERYSKSGSAGKLLLGDTILILYGKPDVDIGRLLAHEMMHSWLNKQRVQETGCSPWNRKMTQISAEEGICQVMAYKWLLWFPSSGFSCLQKCDEQVQYTQKLKEILTQEIECRTDKVYGQGFRDALEAVERIGFQQSLKHIVKNGTLPVVPLPEMIYDTCPTTTTPNTNLIETKTSSTPKDGLLWKKTRSIWKSSVAIITDLLCKTTTSFETPRLMGSL